MRTVFWDWDRANLETFFVELPMTHTIHNIQYVLISNDEIHYFFWPPTKVYGSSNLWRNSPPNFRRKCGNAQLLDGKSPDICWGGLLPPCFHRCSWGLPRQGDRWFGGLDGGRSWFLAWNFAPPPQVARSRAESLLGPAIDGWMASVLGLARWAGILPTPDVATQWFPKTDDIFFSWQKWDEQMKHIFYGLSCSHHAERFPQRSRKWIWNCLLKPGRCLMCQKKRTPKLSQRKGRYSPYETQWNTTTSTYTWNMLPGTLLKFIS